MTETEQWTALATLARQCHAAASPEEVALYSHSGFPLEPGDKARLETLLQQARTLRDAGQLDLVTEPRDFYLLAYPILALALIQIFEDGLTQNLEPAIRRGHIARRLYGQPDDIPHLQSERSPEWLKLNDSYHRYVDAMVAAVFKEMGEEVMGNFYLDQQEHFLTIYRAGLEEFQRQMATE